MKQICAVIPQVARVVEGGLAKQAVRTVQEAARCGVPMLQYHPWKRIDWSTVGAVHIFCAGADTLDIAKQARARGIPIILSPVFFSTHSNLLIRLQLSFTDTLQRVFSGMNTTFTFVRDHCAMADLILPNTDEEGAKISAAFRIAPAKITLMPNGIDPHFSGADPDLFVRTYGDRDIILTVANIGARRKNILALVQALQKIDHPAYIVGPYFDTPYGRSCMKEIEKAPHIHAIGELDNTSAMLKSAYCNSKVFALPSLFET
ncbi:MAG: hypothetical protein ACQEQV_04525, partial [Fibrobacterota bacterium]